MDRLPVDDEQVFVLSDKPDNFWTYQEVWDKHMQSNQTITVIPDIEFDIN